MSKRQRGFSLVEAMVGLAIAGGIGLVVMQQQESSTKMQVKNNVNQVVDSATNVIQAALSNRAVCSMSIRGKGVGDIVPTLFDAQVSPTNIDAEVVVGPNLVDAGQILPGDVKVQEMKIISELGKDYLLVTFNVNPSGRKKMYGPDIVAKSFQLNGVKNSTTQKYTSCNSQMSNAITSARQMACADLGGNWNGVKCVFATVPVYNDTLAGILIPVQRNMIQSGTYSCSNCGSNCNPCPTGWSQASGGCNRSRQQCGFSKWRNCTFVCTRNLGPTPKYGELIINIP